VNKQEVISATNAEHRSDTVSPEVLAVLAAAAQAAVGRGVRVYRVRYRGFPPQAALQNPRRTWPLVSREGGQLAGAGRAPSTASPAPAGEAVPPEMLAVIAAAVQATLGRAVRIHSVRYRSFPPQAALQNPRRTWPLVSREGVQLSVAGARPVLDVAGAAPSGEAVPPEVLAVIAAAAQATLGRAVRIHRVRYRYFPTNNTWPLRGRIINLESHAPKKYT
jgi:hypothetical protein